jgi:hypothetical protein
VPNLSKKQGSSRGGGRRIDRVRRVAKIMFDKEAMKMNIIQNTKG